MSRKGWLTQMILNSEVIHIFTNDEIDVELLKFMDRTKDVKTRKIGLNN